MPLACSALDSGLGASDGSLGQHPIALGELLLESLSLVSLALDVKVPDLNTGLGHDIGTASNNTTATTDKGLDSEVGNTSKCKVTGTLLEGCLGIGSESDSGQLTSASTGELCADNVGVLAELNEEVTVHVKTSDSTRVVVEDDGDGARVGKVDEVVVDGVLAHLSLVVRGRENESGSSANLGGQLAQLNGTLDATLCGSEYDRNRLETGLVQRFSCRLGNGNLLLACTVDGLAVGAHSDKAS
ncbi:hypothetical protein HG531_003527 [Fusarium graminearum]|nr:hypothetical protein HG531_003527 [Fusarium graminearum]